MKKTCKKADFYLCYFDVIILMFAQKRLVVYFWKMEKYLGLNKWLSQKAMARILGVSQQDISAHTRTVLRKNEEYSELFVKKIKTDGKCGRKISRKYYHQFLLEIVANHVRTVASRDFLSFAQHHRRSMNLCMRVITD